MTDGLSKFQRRALLEVRAAGADGCGRPKGAQRGTMATLVMRGLLEMTWNTPEAGRRAPRQTFRLTPAGAETARDLGLVA